MSAFFIWTGFCGNWLSFRQFPDPFPKPLFVVVAFKVKRGILELVELGLFFGHGISSLTPLRHKVGRAI